MWRSAIRRPPPPPWLRLRLVVVGVHLGEPLPLVRELVLGEAGVHRAGLDAGVAVDALVGVDVEHLDVVVVGLVRRRVDAVDRTDLDTRVVLGPDAGLCDYVRHVLLATRTRGRSARTQAREAPMIPTGIRWPRDPPHGRDGQCRLRSSSPADRLRGPGEVPGARSPAPRT